MQGEMFLQSTDCTSYISNICFGKRQYKKKSILKPWIVFLPFYSYMILVLVYHIKSHYNTVRFAIVMWQHVKEAICKVLHHHSSVKFMSCLLFNVSFWLILCRDSVHWAAHQSCRCDRSHSYGSPLRVWCCQLSIHIYVLFPQVRPMVCFLGCFFAVYKQKVAVCLHS